MTQDVSPWQVLLCPSCKFDYVKIIGFSFELVNGVAEFLVSYTCEGCPGGNLSFNFHKGQTFIEEA